MAAEVDAAANVVGRYEGERPGAPALLLGSHIDTVRDAGHYDGNLGVVAAIEAVAALHAAGERLPFAIEVIAFGDEEGVRFPSKLTRLARGRRHLRAAALDVRRRAGRPARGGAARASAAIPRPSRPSPAGASRCWATSSCTSSRARCWRS